MTNCIPDRGGTLRAQYEYDFYNGAEDQNQHKKVTKEVGHGDLSLEVVDDFRSHGLVLAINYGSKPIATSDLGLADFHIDIAPY